MYQQEGIIMTINKHPWGYVDLSVLDDILAENDQACFVPANDMPDDEYSTILRTIVLHYPDHNVCIDYDRDIVIRAN